MSDVQLGHFDVCLNVKNLEASIEFYKKLGFVEDDGDVAERYMILKRKGARIGLYQGHIRRNILNFRGGDIFEIEKRLKKDGIKFEKPATKHGDGSTSAEIYDPDGNSLFFNTFPNEKPKFD